LKIHVESELCVGHAQCHALAPELFPIDDVGHSSLEPHLVRAEDEERTRRGANACPEQAIIIDV
jgi:ferredoxin